MSAPLVVACVAALAFSASPGAAQRASAQPAAASGFWFGGGLGTGWGRVGCDICRSDRGWAPSGYIRLGGRVSRAVLIGAEGTGWFTSEGEDDEKVDEKLWGVSAVAYWYPGRRSGFYWKGGIGLLSYRLEDAADVLTASSLGIQLGLGYDLRLSRNVSFTPYTSLFLASLGGALKFNGAEIQDQVSLSLVQLGVAVTKY